MLNTLVRGSVTAAAYLVLYSGIVIADDFDNLAQNLVKIRAEVESLQSQLDLDKQEHKNQLSSLSSQLTDLEVEKRRKSLVVEELRNKVRKLEERLNAENPDQAEIGAVLRTTLSRLQQHVGNGLPFKSAERLAMLTDLETQLISGATDPRKIATKMWALIEDEVRLAKENGLYQQTITLNDEKRLADVAKVGMMFLYFKTRDDQIGFASHQGGTWRYLVVNDPVSQQQIESLFDTLKKQVRQGFFELPNPYHS